MGVKFHKEINLVSIKSIYVFPNISKKQMVNWSVIWFFLIEILDCKCYPLKNCFNHQNLQILGLVISKMSVMGVIFNLYFYDHSII